MLFFRDQILNVPLLIEKQLIETKQRFRLGLKVGVRKRVNKHIEHTVRVRRPHGYETDPGTWLYRRLYCPSNGQYHVGSPTDEIAYGRGHDDLQCALVHLGSLLAVV